MYICRKCNRTFPNAADEGVESLIGKLYCKACGGQLEKISPEMEKNGTPQNNVHTPSMGAMGGASASVVHQSDNRIATTSNSHNVTTNTTNHSNTNITNIYKGEQNEKVETRYGSYNRGEVLRCKSCGEFIPRAYFVAEAGICQDCIVKIQTGEGDDAFAERLFEEARDCYLKVLNNTYGNEEKRQELMFKLGRCYMELKDGKNAISYFAKTKGSHVDSIYYLGRCSELGLGRPQNKREAIGYYEDAAAKGSSLAQLALEHIRQTPPNENPQMQTAAPVEAVQPAQVLPQVSEDKPIQQPTMQAPQHSEDAEVPQKKNNIWKWAALIIALLVVYFVYDMNNKKEPQPEIQEQVEQAEPLPTIEDTPERAPVDVAVQEKEKEKKETDKERQPDPPVPQVRKLDLGYAVFVGKTTDGLADDVQGRMEFKESHIIDSRDPKERRADPGDYVIGEYSEGHLVQGIWYGPDKQVKGSIIIGK